MRPSCPKPSLRRHCCCRLAADIAFVDTTTNLSSLRHRVVTSVSAILLNPLPQIHICAAGVAITAVLMLPHHRLAVSSKPSLLRHRRCCLDFAAASLLPLMPVHVIQARAATVAAVSPLPFLLLTLPTIQVRSTTVLSQPLLMSCRSFFHKFIFAPLPLLSLPSCYRLTAALMSLPSQVFFAAVVFVLTLLPPLCRP